MIDLDRTRDMRVLFVGDAIMDEYRYVKVVGKAVKEPALSLVLQRREEFKGGVWAAAEHAKGFCAEVDILNGPDLMWNRRQVEEDYLRKIVVEHELVPESLPHLDHNIKDYDCVVVTDFGHGTMTPQLIERVLKQGRYVAVNAQTNGTNYGFNLITKYPRADLVVVDQLEARLAAHDSESPIEDVILKLGFRNIIVTMGKNGAVGFDGAFERQGARTNTVIDTMGAGDAFLSVVAPYAAAGLPMRDLLRIGNAAGAAKCAIAGHSRSVDKDTLKRYLHG